MPELPEVETILRSLEPRVTGRRITSVKVLSPLVANRRPEELVRHLTGQRIHGLRRVGKYMIFDLDSGLMTVHLRMTGRLLYGARPSAHTRVVVGLSRGSLVFDDMRQFGRMEWHAAMPPNITRLGPEPMDVSVTEFCRLLRTRRGAIKPLLLNQTFLSGLGNIYVDESLHQAGIHPLANAAKLSRTKAQRLHAAMVEVLTSAIRAGGSSISDYVDSDGRRGLFQQSHNVYGREGAPCPHCGAAIRRIVVGQRGTHFCPACQKR